MPIGFHHASSGSQPARLKLTLAGLFAPLTTPGLASAAEPAGLGDLQAQLISYHDYGGYERDLDAVAAEAQSVPARAGEKGDQARIGTRHRRDRSIRPQRKNSANQFAYFPSGACDQLPKGRSDGVGNARECRAHSCGAELFRAAAKADGVTVFHNAGRDNGLRQATEKNLRGAGYEVGRARHAPGRQFHTHRGQLQAPARKEIEERGFHIIANVGDQPSDLAGGYAERAFLLPDPFYRIP